MVDFVEDRGIYQKMIDLSGCLCKEITDSGLPETCFCGVWPLGDVVFDGGCDANEQCGQAWVRLIQAFPSTDFPQLDQENGICASPLAYQLEVGIVRCVAVFEDPQGTPPTVARQLDAVRLQMADMAAMRRAVSCCFEKKYPDTDYVLGEYTPTPNLGGVGGGVWTVTTR